MTKKEISLVLAAVVLTCLVLSGCVERKLTVRTIPEGALVTLNDEEIGRGPVTTSFEWYGDYNVRISMPGYETLKTHRKLDRPTHDKFPWDFFATIWPKRIVDEYEWTFELNKKEYPTREELVESATELREQL